MKEETTIGIAAVILILGAIVFEVYLDKDTKLETERCYGGMFDHR